LFGWYVRLLTRGSPVLRRSCEVRGERAESTRSDRIDQHDADHDHGRA
jgi:hypothetical protein